MKRLVKTVELSFFNDDATGEYGLTHKDTQDNNSGTGFNAFWNGMGIFHDVFEHSHEHQNKYFRGDYAMNVGGEMTAMGAMWYYIDQLGMSNRLNSRSMWSPGDNMKQTTLSEVQESITDGYTRYGRTLESNVPKQRPIENGELEYQISDYWTKVKKTQTTTEYEQEREEGINYKKSVTFRKIADLHRYGFRMAERLVPNKWDNRIILSDFFEQWENFCKNNSAEDMQNNFRGVTFKIYKDENGVISWKAIFESSYPSEIQDAVITAKNISYFSIEDYYIINEND